MRITNIAAKNFKGGSFSTPLAAVTILCGANGSGKTSRLDAVAVALSGWHPRLPRTNAGIMQLASGSPMSVTATMADGRTWTTRQWTRKGDKVTKEDTGCGLMEVPSVLLDPDSYFALSDRERVKYVFGLVPMPDAKDTFAQLVADLKNHKFEENTVETEAAITATISNINTWLRTGAAAQVATTQEKLENIIAGLKVAKANADAAVKRMTGTVAGITELAAETLVDPSPEIAAAKQKLERLLGEQRDLQHALTRAAEVRQQRERIQLQIHDLHSGREALNAMAEDVLLLRNQLVNAQFSTVSGLESEVWKLTNEKGVNTAAGAKAAVDVRVGMDAGATRDRLEAELAAAQQEAMGLAELEAELDAKQKRAAVLAQSSRIVPKDESTLNKALGALCEFAGTRKGKTLIQQPILDIMDAVVEMLANNGVEEINLTPVLLDIQTKRHAAQLVARAQQQLAALPPRPDVAALEAALDARREEYRVLDAKLKDAETKLKEARFADQQVAAARLTLAQKEAELARLQEAPKRIKELEAELVALVQPVVQESDLAPVNSCITVARAMLFDLDTAYRRYIAQRGEAATKQKAAQQRSLLEAEAAVAKVAIELVSAKQAAMVEEAFVEVLRVANRVVANVLPGELEYVEGEIGMWRDEPDGPNAPRWVSWRTMSGSEQLVTLAAVAVSLAAASPVKLCMIDEIQRLDKDHSLALMTNLLLLVRDGTIDQCLLAGVTAPELPLRVDAGNVSVVNL